MNFFGIIDDLITQVHIKTLGVGYNKIEKYNEIFKHGNSLLTTPKLMSLKAQIMPGRDPKYRICYDS